MPVRAFDADQIERVSIRWPRFLQPGVLLLVPDAEYVRFFPREILDPGDTNRERKAVQQVCAPALRIPGASCIILTDYIVNALFTVVHIRTFSNAYPPIYSLVVLP